MVSSKDVAKKAKVSQATVSRVLNLPNLVKEETKQKVLAAIDELNYIPNESARNLVFKRSNTISLISGPLENPFYVDTTSNIVKYATSKGYKVNVHFSLTKDIQATYDIALSHKTDGLIVSSILLNDPLIERVQKLNIPLVSFNRRHESLGNFVEIDNFQAGRDALLHLVNYGHRNILWIGASEVVSTFKNRFLGFKQQVCELKQDPFYADVTVRCINYKHVDRPDLQKLLLRLYHYHQLPSAICAATDAIAMEAMDILISLGISVPQDISIIGIDNVKLSRNQLIQLTTIGSVNEQCLGLTAIKKLIELIENPSQENINITLPVSLYLRNSTKNVKSILAS
ncbi:LacI family DNA-binding transcriptional regulator [Actinobacillus porcinus]|uniref:LacI family DNA-binding transcriptional regulator n=1 Tax=Actinobacillus porcinus TaxID=51048 RepID=UPI002355E0A1|nr:LacI family DNA-binding transcriptional regulator [Actinobacillus porcinus]